MSSRVESVQTPDGSFDLTVWLPEAGTGPGLLLIQEIFGVSDYIRAVADDLAGLGYVVAAPDLFWRVKPGHDASHDEDGLKESFGVASQFDAEKGVADATVALQHLSELPEVDGGTGIIGFCLGGSIAYLVAARSELDAAAAELAVVVSFYGSMVPDEVIIKHMVSLCRELHIETIAEMVETPETARVALGIGVGLGQGWCFAKPSADLIYPPPSSDMPVRRKGAVASWG